MRHPLLKVLSSNCQNVVRERWKIKEEKFLQFRHSCFEVGGVAEGSVSHFGAVVIDSGDGEVEEVSNFLCVLHSESDECKDAHFRGQLVFVFRHDAFFRFEEFVELSDEVWEECQE